jgi:hypothetical protein
LWAKAGADALRLPILRFHFTLPVSELSANTFASLLITYTVLRTTIGENSSSCSASKCHTSRNGGLR